MARIRTVEFLPEIFQTPVNRQFLNATLDQLVQEPSFQKTQGYVGRKVGPGVNPNDKYVIEPTQSRTDYQLEPGVVSLNPETHDIENVITYPGINDALNLQGADVTDPESLYSSDYYTWDPFVDFDKFVNYSQYYWLPDGPNAVDISSTGVPLTDNFNVTRANGVYTFSGLSGDNPPITLLRGGNYTFQVAQNNKEDVNFRVTNNTTSAYVIDYQPNATLQLVRGNTYTFTLVLDGVFPFFIKTSPTLGTTNQYNNGVTNNGATTGTITFVVPQDAPDTLYYVNPTQTNMRGTMNIVDATPGSGPGFWIQTDPGVNGRLPYAHNISSRDVLGVINNGEDLGTVTFNVPLSTAQNFYYTLTPIGNIPGKPAGSVDLIVSTLDFNQINNQFLDPFFTANPDGIDGIKELNGKTIVFLNTTENAQDGGWQQTTFFDPLADTDPDTGIVGSYDTTTFDQTTDINSQSDRYSVWQIQYTTAAGGGVYMKLVIAESVANLEKFTINYGTEWASTQWYKNASGYFEQIPLLTAIKDLLFYQDGTDPEIFGQIRLIDQDKSETIFIEDIIDHKNYTSPNGVVFSNGLKVIFRGDVEPASYQNVEYYVEGVGTAIKLLPVTDFVTPESPDGPGTPDYLTSNRASLDLNAWARSNRWFHIDIIYATATYNNEDPVLDNNFRARRPILEFRAGTKLFNFGTQGKQPINIIDFSTTDALSNINGTTGYSIDGYTFVTGTRVIFAADTDPQVKNKVYEVEFISPDTIPPLIAEPIINLVPASDATVLINQSTVCLEGSTLAGKSFYFDGVDWLEAQEKTTINQAPLFDVYDSAGISFSNNAKYPSNTFNGSKLFSYATSNTTPDTVLGFPLRYLSLANVGDIVFDNNLYTDTFSYVTNSVGKTMNISEGFVRQYQDRVTFVREIGWQNAATRSLIRQQFKFVYDGSPLKLDVKVNADNVVPAIQIYINSIFVESAYYTYTTTSTTTSITLTKTYVPGDVIEVAVLSDQVSTAGFYQVPINLENNPLNANSSIFTLGTARSHYETIGENLLALQGPVIGANNSRDLGNIVPYGLQILQQSSPLTMAGYFMRSEEYDIFASIDYNSREYIKFKSLLLETVVRNDYGDIPIAQVVDLAIAEITQGRTSSNPFYWSDMLPTGSTYTETINVITPITTNIFNTNQTYNFTSANYLGLLVYFTFTPTPGLPAETILLVRDVDYVVSSDSPRFTVTIPLEVGDVITIREYSDTAGSFVPNTPSKMGLYPKFVPEIFLDTNYVNPTVVIRGHDGSITTAFSDFRDQVLLEFERRIYDNIKTDGNPIPVTTAEVIPGFFRTTDYSQTTITNILSESFLTWVGWNKLDYKAQDYLANNAFTYNYSAAGNKINETPLLGAWRGIYRYFYDTTSPNYTPWEMLGFSEMPVWWEDRYGPTPYTSDNLVLWDDLEAGYVADPVAPYINPLYVRPGLNKVIPNGTEGQLLDPLASVVGAYNPNAFQKSWAVGDGGPVEASWWSSSSYPYAIMRLLALTRPAEFFSLFADRDLYRYDAELRQYLYNGRYRLGAYDLEIYGDGVSKASYINWIVDYNRQLGINSTEDLTKVVQNIDVRLCYRMASFTDKQYLKVFVERSSPNSTNSSLLLPDDTYSLFLYKNQPFTSILYSSLIVEQVAGGYTVYGYSNTTPYFKILVSASNGVLQTISGGGADVKVPAQYSNQVVQVPYGYMFTNTTMVVDFILSYGAYLETQGLTFDNRVNGYTLNWKQMATEFLYFSQQGWADGTVINLNPSASKLTAYRPGEVVDSIISTTPENMLLNQNKKTLPTRDLIVQRDGDSFSVTSASDQAISFLNLKFTNYEDIVVLNNVSVFSDLIYDPTTAARQNRIRIIASTSTDWNGTLDAQGFILNQANVKEWKANRKYTKGEIVLYKNNYWQAANIVQPKLEFDYNDWYKSNWDKIQQGLLPNIANKADQLANSYNTYAANLEKDNDLLSYGLIGFRPRQYMTDLNLDDVSQVNIYQQFLGTKGTRRAAELFTAADLGKETGSYEIFENWGVLIGTYGANAARAFIELRLNEAYLKSNPSTVQVVIPEQPSQANQTILLSDVWRESYKLTSTDILPTTFSTNLDTALPSAGYVNIEDVDITVFDLNDPSSIAKNIDNVGVGTTIWVAKSNSYNWNIYRCGRVPGQLITVIDNLNGTAVAQFTQSHNLSTGDLVIIRYFSSDINGVYRVISTPSINSIVIAFSFATTNQTTYSGNGLAFNLQTMRVSQASDVASLSYANSLIPGSRAYVDNNGTGHWEVLEKQQQFTVSELLLSDPLVSNSQYGKSLAQTKNLFSALVGSPDLVTVAETTYSSDAGTTLNIVSTRGISVGMVITGTGFTSGQYVTSIVDGNTVTISIAADSTPSGTLTFTSMPGSVFTYLQNATSTGYNQNSQLILNAPYTAGYGNDVVFGGDTWGAAGASTSYNNLGYAGIIYRNPITGSFTQTQVLVRPSPSLNPIKFGTSLAMSDDERWLYVGAPSDASGGKVYAFGRVDIESQTVSYQADGITSTFNWNNSLVIDYAQPNQLIVTVNGVEAVEGVDYSVNSVNITFGSVLPAGQIIRISRRQAVELTGDGTSGPFSLNPYLYTATNIDSFTVTVNGVLQRPYIDYEFNNDSTLTTQDLTFNTIPEVGAIIVVVSSTYWQYTGTISIPGLDADAKFGSSLSTATDGRQIFVGAVRDDADTVANAGSVYVIDRSVVTYQIINTSILTYTIPGTLSVPVSVLLNNQFLNIRNLTDFDGITTTQFINGDVDVNLSTNIITLVNSILNVGDFLTIETNQFQTIQKIVANTPLDESAFGTAIDICPTNCSLYVGMPLDSSVKPQAGSAQRNINQSRVFGVTTSTNANPVLISGDTLRINNIEVIVSNPTIADFVSVINNANIPNVVATLAPDVRFTGDGQTKAFNIGSTYSSANSYTTVVYIESAIQIAGVDYSYNNTTQEILFVYAPASDSIITVVAGRMTLSIKNNAAATTNNKLTVLPGTNGTAFDDIGFTTFTYAQSITSPNPTDFAYFGSSVSVDSSAVNLIIGAPNGNIYEPETFDAGQTYFDDRSTTFFTTITNSGVAYTYDYLPSVSSSISNPGKFVFGQQIYNTNIKTNDNFSSSVNFTSGRLMVGAPGNDQTASDENDGIVCVFDNLQNKPAWTVIHEQQPSVDVSLITGVFMYDKLTSSTQTYFDFFDPLQGKILGAARRNIDYIGAVDPANYTAGAIHNQGNSWGEEHVGEIWWDTDTVRFINPNQDDIVYASRRWGQVFPGSRVDIYQWVASDVQPVSYTGPGIPLSTVSYSVRSSLSKDNIFTTTYYFWVRGITTINTGAGKTLSPTGIAQYIESPRSSGIPYIAALNSSTIAIYNGLEYISAADTILHISYDREPTTANIHTEYEFIADGKPDSFLNATIYRKLQDSFCGVDTAGALVPDPLLSPAERYGVQFRPRQSMFADRFMALENYLGRVNKVLAQYPIVETRRFTLLNSAEPEPAANTGAWNKRVANLEELSFQNIYAVSFGYKYLVVSSSTENGLWSIYEVIASDAVPGERLLQLVRVQNYDTRKYWYHINWYHPGYNSSTQIIAEVPTYSALTTLSLAEAPIGSSVKVTANAQGKFEIYLRTVLGWERVGLEDGTIQFKEELWDYAIGNFGFDVEVFDAQYFDQEPVIETRTIIQAINEELLIDDLAIERNSALILMFNYIYSEFTAPEWLVRTSFIDVNHKIRALLPFQAYLQDNQTFVLDYIQEVKPYHVQIREFNLAYYGQDNYLGDFTDFDVPAYWDTNLTVPQYVSPVLTPYTQSGSIIESTNSDAASDAEVWALRPWSEWYNNYLLGIQAVTVINGGTGYTVPPTIIVTGDCVEPAAMTAVINSGGQVIGVTIDNPGFGYSTTALITFDGGNGSGAIAVSVMGNELVRSIKTVIKYDRYQYTTSIFEWQADVTYNTNDQVRYDNRVWSANGTTSSATFDPTQWTLVDASTLSGADRTMGFYTPTVNEPGLSLPLLIDGIDYPGVQVFGVDFNQNTGFDIGNYDINPFDNISYNPDGSVTFDPALLDAIYESNYLDPYLGTNPAPAYNGAPPNLPTAVVVDGGAYVDTYESHAPEELVPGIEFDTLDFRVYTTPGANWDGQGHGFPIGSVRYVYNPANPVLSFANILPNPFTVIVFNVTLGLAIEPVSYDWANYEVTVGYTESPGDLLDVYVTGVGGGNQLYINTYLGSDIGDTIIVPFPYNSIYEFVIYNGEIPLADGVDYTYAANDTHSTIITFATTYGATDRINLATLGYAPSGPTLGYSLPIFQTWIADGGLTLTLTNSLQGTNPVNLVVTRNGVRARPYEGANYTGDGSTVVYDLPSTGNYNQNIIVDSDVSVYVNNTLVDQGTDYNLDAYSVGDLRTITFVNPPQLGDQILISVSTIAQYLINGDQLTFQPSQGLSPIEGDIIEIITWNDTAEQQILTQVFVGPTTTGILVSEGYDDVDYDVGSVDDAPGSYDYSTGAQTQTNTFDTGRLITNAERILVTLNGKWLFVNAGFSVDGTYVTIDGPIISTAESVVITSFTQEVVPSAMAFRIFQDMRGVQATYRITSASSTTLTQPLLSTDDIIYVADANVLGIPDVANNIWGVIMINGERIMYRDRNIVDNTVSSLLRGTAGTAIDDHVVESTVTDMGRGNLLAAAYQDYINSNTFLADGSTISFTADNVEILSEDSTIRDETLEVYVGGALQSQHFIGDDSTTEFILSNPALVASPIVLINHVTQTDGVDYSISGTTLTFETAPTANDIVEICNYTIVADSPVTIEFIEAPGYNLEVTILVRRGVTWYQQGVDSASDGIPLQDTNTQAARFLRGL